MKIPKWFYILLIFLTACQGVTGEVFIKPYALPLKVSVNTRGEIGFSIEGEIATYPTPLGIVGVGVVVDPTAYFDVENTLTVRFNGEDHIYDLHGEDFDIEFQQGYYHKIDFKKNGTNFLLELERKEEISDSQNQDQVADQEDPAQFIKNYYGAINNRQYDYAWSLLSDDFVDRNHGNNVGGYGGYVDWWNSVSSVTVTSTETKYHGVDTAKVVVILHYEMNNNSSYDDKVYFQLIYDKSRSTWLIDATPTDWNV